MVQVKELSTSEVLKMVSKPKHNAFIDSYKKELRRMYIKDIVRYNLIDTKKKQYSV